MKINAPFIIYHYRVGGSVEKMRSHLGLLAFKLRGYVAAGIIYRFKVSK